jgi:NADH-quinone oxidoreductase subunit M
MLQMFSHGLTASALFYFVGLIEQRSGGLRGLDDFGGLRKAAPVFCGLMGITLFASLGLPGLNGFVSEFLIFKGSLPLVGWAAAVSTLGLLITAIFLLTILQRVFSGPLQGRWAGWKRPDDRRTAHRGPMVIGLMLVLGVCPQILISVANPAALAILKLF